MKKRMAAVLLALTSVCFLGGANAGANYPNRAVEMVFPFGAGGSDALYRSFARAMSGVLGEQIVFLNRDGAAGAIGTAAVARAKPDGYTLMVSPSIVMTNLPHVQDSITYDYEAFDYVCQTAVNVFSINVRADSPY